MRPSLAEGHRVFMTPDRASSRIPRSGAGEGRGIRVAMILAATVTSLVSLVAPVAGVVALVTLAFGAALVWSFPAAMLAYVFLEQTLANVFLLRGELFGLLLVSWAIWHFSGRRARVQSFDSVDWAVLLYG
ncbi:MAG: hypothetical protein HYX76_06265, partial [Acidobacteria bacterium]|nr:hypothetical protein [Acidobacteriota bacterium]